MRNGALKTETRIIYGQAVEVTICPPAKARGSEYKRPWTVKSKNYKRNGPGELK